MRRGTILEPIAADEYTRETGRALIVVDKMLQHPTRPYILGNLDRIIEDDGQSSLEDRGPGVLEIKCPGLHVFNKCKLQGLQGYYIAQLQHYLGVTGCKWGSFQVFSAERWESIWFDMERDDSLIEMMFDRDEQFWHLVETMTPPATEPEAPVDMPQVGGELVNLDGDYLWEMAVADFREARELAKTAAEIEEQAKARLQKMMGELNASVAEGAGVRIYWKEQAGRKTFDKAKLAKDHPEIDLSKYDKQGKPFRAFKPYFLNNRVSE
jgi:predicted phage-related endonuclease